jgi:hypothetical protein
MALTHGFALVKTDQLLGGGVGGLWVSVTEA